jgi:hypothetical protein
MTIFYLLVFQQRSLVAARIGEGGASIVGLQVDLST